MNKLLVTGTDTDVGKTWISCLLIRQLRAAGKSVGAYKPACSGAETDIGGSYQWRDVSALSMAVGDECPIDRICPQRFHASIAPNEAARLEGRTVDDQLLRTAADAWSQHCNYLIIEGAGGLMCPLSDESTVLNLAKDLSTPVLIVAANRLGVINHTLLTVEVARSHGLSVAGIVVNTCVCRLPATTVSQPVSGGPTKTLRQVDQQSGQFEEEGRSNDPDDLSPKSNMSQLLRILPDFRLFLSEYNGTSLLLPDGDSTVDVVSLFAN